MPQRGKIFENALEAHVDAILNHPENFNEYEEELREANQDILSEFVIQ